MKGFISGLLILFHCSVCLPLCHYLTSHADISGTCIRETAARNRIVCGIGREACSIRKKMIYIYLHIYFLEMYIYVCVFVCICVCVCIPEPSMYVSFFTNHNYIITITQLLTSDPISPLDVSIFVYLLNLTIL